LVSFAVGGLFGDAFIHLLPESYQELGFGPKTSLLVVTGILLFFLLEKILRWHHCHDLSCREQSKHLASLNIIGDGVHNFIDGVLIAVSFSAGITIGISSSLAIMLHEIPQEIGDFGILLHSGLSVKKAIFYNFLSAGLAVVGAIAALLIGPAIKGFSTNMLPVAAGGFIYLAGSDLIPELHKEEKIRNSILQFLFIVSGIGIMALLGLID